MNRILVVEDDPAILRGLTDNLQFESYEVLAAADGETGYRLIREKNPDLIILDVMLPRMNGYELCRKVRGEGVNTPIVMLTARGEEADRVLGLDLGASDYVTKPFSVRELLARIRATLRQQRQLLIEDTRLNQEVRVAAEVQQRLFPQIHPRLATLDYAAVCRPACVVSGDYYDFLPLAPGRLALLVADVVGKGISAALLMASVHASVRAHAPLLDGCCSEVVARASALLCETTGPDRFVTMFYAVYDDATRRLAYVNAGHPPALLVRGLSATLLESAAPPVGIFPNLPVAQQSAQLAPGDWLLIFSDGVSEAFNERDEQFGEERLVATILANRDCTAAQMRDAILEEIVGHSGGRPQSDDLTLVAAHVL